MKTVFTSHEIAHIWAHKAAPYGKSPGAVSFDGPVIRSYSTAIARHVEHKGKAAVIYNATSYSVSTSKHQGRIWMAIRHNEGMPVFRVDGQEMGADLRFTGDELFTYYVKKAAQHLRDTEQPRIRPHTVEAHKGRAAQALEQAQAVASFYGLRRKIDAKAVERLAAAKARAEKKEQREREKRDAAERLRQEENYKAWICGDGQEWNFDARLFPVAFRVEGDELVSTLGARVPLRAARIAYRFALAKRAQGEWRENGETCPVGNYRLNAINAQGIVAGCHRISWAEIERLAPVLGAEEPATVNAAEILSW